MNSRQLMLKLSAAMLCASTLILSGCGGGGAATATTAPTTTLSQSTIQLPTQVQVVSPK